MVKGDPLKVVLGTITLTLIVSLDGDGSTTYMICVAAMLPLYKRLGMSPLIMACLIMLSSGIMNLTPWGGPTARAASALHVDPSDVFVPMVLPMLFAISWLYFLGTMYGRMERKRLGIVQLDISHGENIQISDNPEANRADLRWFNALLTVVLMICLVFSILPMSILFMVALCIALVVNYKNVDLQKKLIAHHAGSALNVVGIIFAAGIFTGILAGTGMVEAMSKQLVAIIPESMGPYLAPITAVISMPMTFFMSNDAFYFGGFANSFRCSSSLWNCTCRNGTCLHRRATCTPTLSTCPFDLFTLWTCGYRVWTTSEIYHYLGCNHVFCHVSSRSDLWNVSVLFELNLKS